MSPRSLSSSSAVSFYSLYYLFLTDFTVIFVAQVARGTRKRILSVSIPLSFISTWFHWSLSVYVFTFPSVPLSRSLSSPPSRRRSAARPDWPVHVCTTAAITISSRAFLSARSYVRSEMNWVIVKSCPAGCNCPRVPRHVRTRPQATSSIFHSGSPFASVDIERAYQVEISPHSSPSELPLKMDL